MLMDDSSTLLVRSTVDVRRTCQYEDLIVAVRHGRQSDLARLPYIFCGQDLHLQGNAQRARERERACCLST